MLGTHVAVSYWYDEQGKDDCDAGTRSQILAELDAWVQAKDVLTETQGQCLWITGVAGVGKSAIAITVVKNLLDRLPISSTNSSSQPDPNAPILGGQYYVKHSDETSDVHKLFPTLALQLAEVSPLAALAIENALMKKPTLASEFCLEQAQQLFLAPLEELVRIVEPRVVTVVVDGLDELKELELLHIEVLQTLARTLPQRSRLLLLSRIEGALSDIPKSSSPIKQRPLPRGGSQADVRNIFENELPHITSKLNSLDFPTDDHLDSLCKASDGFIIWAKRAIQWFKEVFKYKREPGLSAALNDLSALPPGDIGKLYRYILDHSLPTDIILHQDAISEIQSILRCLAVLEQPQSIGVIAALVSTVPAGVVHAHMKRLSGLYASTADITEETTPEPHKSFFDYLTSQDMKKDCFCVDCVDNRRSKPSAPALKHSEPKMNFYFDRKSVHFEVATGCFKIMENELHFNMGGFDSARLDNAEPPAKVPLHISYVCVSIGYHVEHSGKDFSHKICEWATKRMLFWLEVIALSGHKERAANILKALFEVNVSPWLFRPCSLNISRIFRNLPLRLLNSGITCSAFWIIFPPLFSDPLPICICPHCRSLRHHSIRAQIACPFG